MESGWYFYDGMERPKLKKLKDLSEKFIGRINCIVYLLTTISKL